MEATLKFTTNINLTVKELTALVKQLPKKERLKLVSILQMEDEEPAPSKEQLLGQLKEDIIALKNGTLKTRPLKDLLDEL